LGSFRKKILYFLSLVAFVAFIIFLNRGYYFSDNQRQRQTVYELKQEQYKLNTLIDSLILFSDFNNQNCRFEIRNLLLKAECDTVRRYDAMQISTLIKQYLVTEDTLSSKNDSLYLAIKEKYKTISELTQQIDSNVLKECDTYFNILINILSAFIAFLIAFTFKNKILF